MSTCTSRGIARATLRKTAKAQPLEPTTKREKKRKNTDRIDYRDNPTDWES